MADNNSFLSGSICLTDIPKSQIKRVMCKDGKERAFLNIAIFAKKQPQTFGDRTYTHFVSCAPKAEEREEGVNYIMGDLETRVSKPKTPTTDTVANAPGYAPNEKPDLPF
ncbi:hypothetical protein [Lepagella muris]|uniref:hypothetical protein n=1 Tax=Lepagella muris TaxID=3032870 RepID=UPI0023B77D1F|nr:hypothetical protein [Lepagella muris]